MFRLFEEDPFFSGFNERLQGFDMFDARSPYSAIENNRSAARSRQLDRYGVELPRHNQRGSQLASYSVNDPFVFMDSIMPNMNSMIGKMFQNVEHMQNDPNGYSFMQSSVMSYSSDGNGQPKIYQATSSTRQAPGGIRETRKAVRDSEVGKEKMSIGRHLNDRGHVITRERSMRTGEIGENQDYINLDEAEANQFNEEWIQKTSQYGSRQSNRLGSGHRSTQQRHHAIDYRLPVDDETAAMRFPSRRQNRHVKYDDYVRRVD